MSETRIMWLLFSDLYLLKWLFFEQCYLNNEFSCYQYYHMIAYQNIDIVTCESHIGRPEHSAVGDIGFQKILKEIKLKPKLFHRYIK